MTASTSTIDKLWSDQDEHALAALLVALDSTGRATLAEALEKVHPDDFYRPAYGELWHIARDLQSRRKRVTKRAIREAASDTAAKILDRLSGEVWSPHDVAAATAALPSLAKQRRLVMALQRSLQNATATSDYSEALAFAHQQLTTLDEADTTEVVSWRDAYTEWEEWMTSRSDSTGRIIDVPWHQVTDFLNGGLRTGAVCVVGARPGCGKSLVLSNIAIHASAQHHVALFSLEMGRGEVTNRIVSDQANTSLTDIQRRNIDPHDSHQIQEFRERSWDHSLVMVDNPRITVEKITSICRVLKRQRGLDLVCIDYLQLVTPSDKRVSREQQVAHISRMLKILSRELDIAILVAAQLNREATGGKTPEPSDLRESGSVEQDADVVLLLHHIVDHGIPTGECEFHFAKNRAGRRGVARMIFNPGKGRFE